jgi:hypothetical protein
MAYESELEAELEDEYEGELEDESEDEMEEEMEDESEGEGWLGALGNIAGSLLGESEDEYEDEYEDEGEAEMEAEDEYEDEYEVSPIRKIYPDAMMEHLGELAAESESEEEAVEHLAAAPHMAASKILPVVAKVAKVAKGLSKAAHVAKVAKAAKVAHAVNKAVPRLTKAIGKVVRTLHRNPQTRHLLKTVPHITRRTVGKIATHAARGGRITPRAAVRTLARQTRRVLGTPKQRGQALRRHNHLERRFHRHGARGYGRPHRRHGRWYRGYGRGARVRGAAPRYGTRGQIVRSGGRLVRTGVPARGVGVPARGVRYGQIVGGQCTCPSCGTAAGPGQTVQASPNYCRCCGQIIR